MTIRSFVRRSAVVVVLTMIAAISIYAAMFFSVNQSTTRPDMQMAYPLEKEGNVKVSRLAAISAALDESAAETDQNNNYTAGTELPSQQDLQDAEFDQQARQLALKVRSTTSGEVREKLIGQLKTLNDRHFEHRQQQRKQEIERLSARVDSLRQSQKRREQNKSEILVRRLNELLDPETNLNWDDVEKKGPLKPSRDAFELQKRSESAAEDSMDSVETSRELADSSVSHPNLDSDPAVAELKEAIAFLKKQIDESRKRFDPRTSEVLVEKYRKQLDETRLQLADIQRLRRSEPKFEGTTLSEWLGVLKTERSLAKINSALIAIRFLAAEADPKLVVSTIARMAQSQSKLKDGQVGVDITPQITEVFYELPADVAVNALLEQLRQLPPRVPSKGLKRLVASLFGAINNSATCRTEYCEVYLYEPGHESSEISFRRAVLLHSRQLIQTLAQIAQSDHSEDDWVVETSLYILEASEQILSNYPELIPVVKRVFKESRLPQLQEVSAGLLCESGIDCDQVVDFFRVSLPQRRRQCKIDNYGDYQFLVNQIVKGARSSTQLIDLLAEELTQCYDTVADENFANLAVKQILITGLGRVGNMARSKLPLLEEAEAHESSIKLIKIYDQRLFAIKPGNPSFKDLIADVIQQIQESKPKPQPQPLLDESPSVAMPADQFSGQRTIDPVNVTPINETPKTESNPLVEKTFDGVPYSQWLKMLESERKPEKLATSIDACSRLAEARDEHRIARGIFRAAGLFENGDPQEQMRVWNAAQSALARLPAEIAIDELIEALRDEATYRAGREFQGNHLLQTTLRSNKPIQARADELINLLMKRIRDGGKGTGELFAAASEVWARSDRPLSDFPELNTMVLNAIQEGPIVDPSNPEMVAYDKVPHQWWRAMSNLIEKNPETPDLALSLVKHAGKSHEVVALIGYLGRRAEPAVPQLVDHFLTEWKPLELKRRDEIDWKEPPRVARISPEEEGRHVVRCLAVIEALGRIGSGPKGYALLRQLKLISPSLGRFSDGDWNEKLDSAWQKMASFPEGSENLLSDSTLIRGHWALRSQWPAKKHPSSFAKIDYTWFELGDEEQTNFSPDSTDIFNFAGWWPSWRYEIDETKNPKRISIFRVDSRNRGPTAVKETEGTRRFGIYEITETTLRIQFAKVGENAPSEIVMDESQLPEGHILLKFDRTLEPPKPMAGE